MSDMFVPRYELEQLITQALIQSNVSEPNATSVARALTQAQLDGQIGHGVSRVASYCAQARTGKVQGHATPHVVAETASALRIDAGYGFAFPAIDVALQQLSNKARSIGIAAASIFRSHHFGVAGWHVERLAEQGLIALIVGNSPAAIAPYGGSKPIFGTNPIAFAAPRSNAEPLVIDMSPRKRGGTFQKVGVSTNRGIRRQIHMQCLQDRCCHWAAPKGQPWFSLSKFYLQHSVALILALKQRHFLRQKGTRRQWVKH